MTETAPPPAADPRQERGLLIASKKGAVRRVKDDLFAVRSQSGVGQYRVERAGESWRCNCPDAIKRDAPCKHALAVRFYLEARKANGEVERVPLSYSQAWSTYNSAQTQEIRLFDALLADLVDTLKEDGPKKRGNQPLPLREQVFCAVQKVYSQLSSRRAATLFSHAAERKQLDHAPHFNAPSKLLNRADATPILHALIAASARPLAEIEMEFAVDSTGFRTTSFGAYCGEKHGTKRQNIWLKAHLCTGVKTHVVARVTITDSNGADSPQLPGLVRGTAGGGFRIAEVSADPAYSGRVNHEAIGEVGGVPFILFRSNASGKTGGSPMWRKAFHFFQMHRDEFDVHYHKRSNIESAISALKRKFGETLKSKNRIAQENELLCKVLAYNITVLIHEMHENGVEPDFAAPIRATT